jgi:bacterioferritin (cytochrome b1)
MHEKSIELLNKAVAEEISATLQYKRWVTLRLWQRESCS